MFKFFLVALLAVVVGGWVVKRKSKLPLCKQTLPKQKHGAEIESKVESRVACKNKHIHLTKHGHIFHASTSVASRLQLMHVVPSMPFSLSHTESEETRDQIDFPRGTRHQR